MMKNLFIFFAIFTLSFSFSKAQTIIPPVDIPLFLSGNFGELRPNHFHAGIDFKTQGNIGIPIKAVKAGFISRIFVSPSGYGRALYVEHPDGTTSVYGHLDHFASKIESFVLDSQYIKQTFSVDMQIPRNYFEVKQGEMIGYSGNTGSSGGPHLHFEIRNTKSSEVLDALSFYKNQIKDNRKPQIQSLMVYPLDDNGMVNNEPDKQIINTNVNKTGKKGTNTIQAWGKIGIAVKAYDYMDDTFNSYGVKEIILTVDGMEIYHSDMDHFDFSETRYINSFIDWEQWHYKKSFYMKSFIEPGNKLRIYKTRVNDGIITIDQEKVYKLNYTLKDIYGNATSYDFTIDGKKQQIPTVKHQGDLFRYNRENSFINDEVSLTIPKGCLYTDVYFNYNTTNKYTPYSPLYTLGERMPLHTYCPLLIKIKNDTFSDKEKYGIVFVNGQGRSWVGGKYVSGYMLAEIRELGSYTVTIDTVAPSITELNSQLWNKTKKISFKIKDNLSGIKNWTAFLDGQFVLFEFDAKTANLFCKYDSQRMKKGKQKLKLQVEDKSGNKATYEKEISW